MGSGIRILVTKNVINKVLLYCIVLMMKKHSETCIQWTPSGCCSIHLMWDVSSIQVPIQVPILVLSHVNEDTAVPFITESCNLFWH